ncbi:MAG: proline iminopeptidase-family hydrolase [Bryobacteraceae bacterium]
MRRREIIGSIAASALAGCATQPQRAPSSELKLPSDGTVRTGGARMIPIPGGYRVWTKKVGDAPIKVLLLHGGPGGDHTYFECFEDFLPQNGVEFYYYDQLDSTNSDKPGDPKLWTIERFRDEVEAVRAGLGLEQFYLLGHSWGGMLAIEYALAYPKHLKGLVISNMVAGIQAYEKHTAALRAALPKETIAILDKYEKAGKYEAPEYQKAMFEQVYTRHLCRLQPWPEPVERAFRNLNPKIYGYLQGPNEFVVTGKMKGWERWADLPKIQTRTLVIGAQYDEMDPDDMRKVASAIPNAKAWISEKGSHMAMWDDQVPYFRALLEFLKQA